MPLHLICECCKCKESLSQDLWAISRDHKYAESRYLCEHFDVEIDHVSSTGFFGIGWRNEIMIRAYYKPTRTKKNVISRTFNKNSMEYQNYAKFNKVVIHARISDSRYNYPTIGNSVQDDIEYNEERERRRQNKIIDSILSEINYLNSIEDSFSQYSENYIKDIDKKISTKIFNKNFKDSFWELILNKHTSILYSIKNNIPKIETLNFMIAGMSGAGKSSLTNAILKEELAKVGDNIHPETDTFKQYTNKKKFQE